MKSRILVGAVCGIALIAIFTTGCKKTIINNYYCECQKDTCKDSPSNWYGLYAIPGQLTQVDQSTFINNGIAKLANSPYGGLWFEAVRLDIPPCRQYSADSLKLEARVRNPLNEGAIEQLDVSLLLGGTKDTVYVNYVGRATHTDFTRFGVYNGSPLLTSVPELVQLFQDWTTVSIEVKNGQLYTYRNGALMKQISLNGVQLGKLNMISVGFKGVGSVDWVKVYDNAGTVKIKEEFNTNQQSTVEYF